MKIRRVDFYPDDWLVGTKQLDPAEVAVYITICALIYATGGPIPEELIHDHLKIHGTMLRRCLNRLKTLEKITGNGSKISQKRCENELERAAKRHENARKNVSKRWENNKVEDTAVSKLVSQSGNANIQQPTNNIQQEGDSPLVVPPFNLESAPNERKRRPKKQALPADWQPDEQDCQYAHSRGYDDAWIGEQGLACLDHNLAHGKTYLDFHAMWRTWVRNAEKFAGRAPPPRTRLSQQQGDDILRAAVAARTRNSQGPGGTESRYPGGNVVDLVRTDGDLWRA